MEADIYLKLSTEETCSHDVTELIVESKLWSHKAVWNNNKAFAELNGGWVVFILILTLFEKNSNIWKAVSIKDARNQT